MGCPHGALELLLEAELQNMQNEPATSNDVSGELVHLVLMCRRYVDCSSSTSETEILRSLCSCATVARLCDGATRDRTEATCALSACTTDIADISYKKCWCSKQHFLEWLVHLIAHLQSAQLCRLENCFRHVCVEEDVRCRVMKVRSFCSWEHSEKYYTRLCPNQSGESERDDLMDKLVHPHIGNESWAVGSQQESTQPVASGENFDADSPLHWLQVARKLKTHTSVVVNEGFFMSHPWEILSKPGETCIVLIARCMYKDRKREKWRLTTRDGYHWKQQGRPSNVRLTCNLRCATPNRKMSKKYFTYARLRGKRSCAEQGSRHTGDRGATRDQKFYMEVYSLDIPSEYCMVRLHKGRLHKPFRHVQLLDTCCRKRGNLSPLEETPGIDEGLEISRKGESISMTPEMVSCRMLGSHEPFHAELHMRLHHDFDEDLEELLRGFDEDLEESLREFSFESRYT